MKVTVITVSDRASTGEYEDLSGPAIEKILLDKMKDIHVRRVIVPDDREKLTEAFKAAQGDNFILTTGGTGLSPRDITPETTEVYCDKALPGIAEILRVESYKQTPNAMLSRGYAGMKDKTIIVNFPGSVRAVVLCTELLIPAMEHALKMQNCEGH